MYSKEMGTQGIEFTSNVLGLARQSITAGRIPAILSDRWLFDHVSWLSTYAFSALRSGHSPRLLWKLVKFLFRAKYIKEPKYTETSCYGINVTFVK